MNTFCMGFILGIVNVKKKISFKSYYYEQSLAAFERVKYSLDVLHSWSHSRDETVQFQPQPGVLITFYGTSFCDCCHEPLRSCANFFFSSQDSFVLGLRVRVLFTSQTSFAPRAPFWA